MSWTKTVQVLTFLASTVSCAAPLAAQGVTDEMLKHPPRDSWPGFHGDYTGQRHSSLTEINPQNVSNMTLAWTFQTQQNGSVKSTPIFVDGILYFGDYAGRAYAVRASDGHPVCGSMT